MVNKVQNSLEERLIRKIARLESELYQLKTLQPVGGDVVEHEKIPVSGPAEGGPIILNANQKGRFTINFTNPELTNINYLFTIYVDVFDSGNSYPFGNNLTAGQEKIRITHWIDRLVSSNFGYNNKYIIIEIENLDTVTHSYYFDIDITLPKLGATLS